MAKSKSEKKICLRFLSKEGKEKFAAINGITLPTEAPTPSSAPESSAPTPADTSSAILKHTDSVDQASESNATPAPGGDASTPNSKKGKGSIATAKRAIGQANGDSKPRGKPGPKKKPRNDDGTIDHTTNAPITSRAPGTGGAHKLNPKTNAGAINANLRALDRSGKPCRRWERKAFSVKSFTGVTWDMPSWKGGEKPIIANGDSSSETKDVSMNGSSEIKPDNQSDVVMSNTGEAPVEPPADPMAMSTPAASSPPPAPAQPAVVAAAG